MITIVLVSNYVPYIEMLLQKEKPQTFATSKAVMSNFAISDPISPVNPLCPMGLYQWSHQSCESSMSHAMPQMSNCCSTGVYGKMCACSARGRIKHNTLECFCGIKKQKGGSYLHSQLHFVCSACSIPFQVYYHPTWTPMEQAWEQLHNLRGTTSLLPCTQDDELFFSPWDPNQLSENRLSMTCEFKNTQQYSSVSMCPNSSFGSEWPRHEPSCLQSG